MQFEMDRRGRCTMTQKTGVRVTGGGLPQPPRRRWRSETNKRLFLPAGAAMGTPMLMVARPPYEPGPRHSRRARKRFGRRSSPVVPADTPAGGCLPRRNHRHRHTGRRGAGLAGRRLVLARHAGRRRTADGNGPLRCVPHCAAWAGGCRARYRSKHCSGGRRADGAHLDRKPPKPAASKSAGTPP